MSDLSSDAYVGWLKRQVAVPGEFEITFTESSDEDVAAALVDGLYRAKLDGWLPAIDANPDTLQTTPDITMTMAALIVVYTSITWIQNQLGNLITAARYEAPGPIVADEQRAATVLAERLKEVQAEREQLLQRALKGGGRGLPVFMRDGYAIRVEELYYPEATVAFVQPSLSLL